ncbi:uncharacterized protein LOC110982460 [Acanthaster planci]|uniref:Uncharacterized protein LOC110982460 n=1 Tax=Acanthaster planci TaxID=133434 RepID=A0A8B7YTD5_ACAPL|nr:uncharacterized protein LOC110982460 [Acanthaster planci]
MSTSNHSGGNSLPLVLYIHVTTTETQQDTRQKVYENKSAADGFPQFQLRSETVAGGAVFDQMMTLFWTRITEEDFRRLQMIIINGYGQTNTGCLGDSEFTGAYLKLILLSLVHRFSPETINNWKGHEIAVVCAQCYSHVFVQHAKCVPATDPVYHFVPLTTAYQPYLINPELPEKMPFVKWDTRSFLKNLLLSPKRSISSEDYVLGPSPTSPRTHTPRPASRTASDITQSPTSSPW